jgi:hypothetical protein
MQNQATYQYWCVAFFVELEIGGTYASDSGFIGHIAVKSNHYFGFCWADCRGADLVSEQTKNFSLGPLSIKKEQENQSTMFFMNIDNDDHDAQLQIRLRSLTNAMRTRLINSFQEYNLCSIMYSALASSIRWPLYESIANNHFTEVLLSDSIDDYKKRIFGLIEDEYRNMFSAALRTTCQKDNVPVWEDAVTKLRVFFEHWIQQLILEVIRTCKQKLDTYNRYLPSFTHNADDYRGNIIKQCIEKNERYIKGLENVLAQEKRNAT